jgi:hypothetical protein
MSANQNFQGEIKGHPAIKSVFANCRLIGTAWIQANTLKPGDGKLDAGNIRSGCWDQLFQLSQYQRRQKLSRQGHKPQSRDLERPAK